MLPALWTGAAPVAVVGAFTSGTPAAIGALPLAAPGAVNGPHQALATLPRSGPKQISVMVVENTPKSVIDLGAVFRAMSGLQHEDGLQLSLLGNTNSGLVRTDLSESELTLHYAPGRCGKATIMVGATDADRVSAQVNILVTVLPLKTAATGGTLPTPVNAPKPSGPATPPHTLL